VLKQKMLWLLLLLLLLYLERDSLKTKIHSAKWRGNCYRCYGYSCCFV